jgi:hypothetical protein
MRQHRDVAKLAALAPGAACNLASIAERPLQIGTRSLADCPSPSLYVGARFGPESESDMRLLDQVFQAKEPVVARNAYDRRLVLLPGVGCFSDMLPQCRLRYVLEDDVTSLCARIAFEPNGMVGACTDILRAPASLVWVEFNDSARHGVPPEANLTDSIHRGGRQRIGVLAATCARGRQGELHVCWEGQPGFGPEAAPFVAEFDLDNPALSETADGESTFAVRTSAFESLNRLFGRIRFRLRPQWLEYYRVRVRSQEQFHEVVREAMAPLCADMPFLAAFFLLAMTGRALRAQPVDRSLLNRARGRTGKPALLAHQEISLNLTRASAAPDAGAGAGGGGRSRRLHLVRGHLVRRGGAVFWRTSHMRGDAELGVISSRTISLRLGAA